LAALRACTYGDFKIDHFLRESAHLVVEAETVFSHFIRREHEVALPLLGSIEDNPVRGADNQVVDIE
jgi:hypothetical protein